MNRLQKEPVLVYVPEVPATPAIPAYCITETVLAGYAKTSEGGLSSGGTSSSSGVPYLDNKGNVSYQGPSNGGGSVGSGSGRRPIYKTRTTCFPAVASKPAVPARTDIFSSVGWNAGARSVVPMPAAGYFQCRIPVSPAGIVIGLSNGAYDHGYGHASHAVVFRRDGMAPIRYGENLAVAVPLVPGALVRFERSNGIVSVLVDGELFHTFATPLTGQVFADVTLYGLADYVDDPEIGTFPVGIDADAPAWVGVFSADEYCGIAGVAPMAQLSAYARAVEGLSLTAPAAVGFVGAVPYCGISGRAPMPRWKARSGSPEAEDTGILGYAPIPQVVMVSRAGVLASIDGTAPAVQGFVSAQPYCGISSVWGGHYSITSWQPYLPAGVSDGGDLIFAADFGLLDNVVMFIVYDGIGITENVDLVLLVSMEAYEYFGIGDPVTLGGVIQLLAMERVAVNSSARAARQEALQYAVNVLTGALTTYQNFGFTQFASAGGETYGIRPDGLYCLRGDTDAGQTLNAVIDFGASDYGTAQGKRISHVYAGVTTDGEVYVRVTPDDGHERVYRAVGESPELRAPVGKGMKARHWRLRLELTDATYADLDNIEVELGVSQRRLRSRAK